MGRAAVIVRAARPPFLLLTPVCVLLGASQTLVGGAPFNIALFLTVLAGALCAHASVNLLNEFFDYRSGLDEQTQRTPFSGGSGALPAHPAAAPAVLIAGCIALAVVLLIGWVLIRNSGAELAPLGIAGILVVLIYTPVLNRSPLLCLLAPGFVFGVLMVIGTHYVLAGGYEDAPWLAAAVPFFLTNNLLLLNQYPDLAADAAAGRRHFPLAFGLPAANSVYGVFVLLAAAAIVAGVGAGVFPPAALIALLPLALALYALSGAVKYGRDIGGQRRYLAANVAVALLAPLLLAVTLIVGDMQ